MACNKAQDFKPAHTSALRIGNRELLASLPSMAAILPLDYVPNRIELATRPRRD